MRKRESPWPQLMGKPSLLVSLVSRRRGVGTFINSLVCHGLASGVSIPLIKAFANEACGSRVADSFQR